MKNKTNNKMIRRSQISITESNPGKLSALNRVMDESKIVLNLYINEIWKRKDFSSKFVDFKVDTWLTSRMQQCLGKQALEVVKSQRKKKKKHKPVIRKDTINLDSRFIELQVNENSFDFWFKFNSVGSKICLNLPGRKHKHFFKYSKSWTQKKSYRLRKVDDKYFIDLYFEKKPKKLKKKGKDIGVDLGYNKLIVTSEDKKYDTGLKPVYEKINRKKQGSNAFKRALKERDNHIGRSVNQMPFDEIKMIVAEDLKKVKHKKGKKSKDWKEKSAYEKKKIKSTNNKLQRWSYSKVLDKLSLRCEELGILFKKVCPAYTSQTCSSCGFIHAENRYGESFVCLECGCMLDADYNASLNILALGSLRSSLKVV